MLSFKNSYAFRLFALFLGLLIVPVLLAFLGVFYWEYNQKISTEIQRLRDIGVARAVYLNNYISNQFQLLDLVEIVVNLSSPDDTYDRTPDFVKMASLASLAPNKGIGFFVRQPGDHYLVQYASNKAYLGKDFTYRGYIQEAAKKGYAAYLDRDLYTDQPEFVISKAVRSYKDYSILGMLMFFLPAEKIIQKLINDEYFSKKEVISILTQDKIAFTSSDPSYVLSGLAPVTTERIKEIENARQFGNLPLHMKTLHLTPYLEMDDIFVWEENNNQHIAVITPVADKSIYIWMDTQKSTIAAPYIRAVWMTLSILLGITIISSLVTLLIGKFLISTFEGLISVMGKVTQGDLTARFNRRVFGFEINSIGAILNQNLDRLITETKRAQDEVLKTEKLSKELKAGREIQESLLPHDVPSMIGLEIGTFTRAASEVHGDFFDIYSHNDDLIITISGTSHKGLIACLYSVCLRSMLRCFAVTEKTMSGVLEKTNAVFQQNLEKSPIVIKTFIGIWEVATSTLRYASASPSFGFVRRANEVFESLAGSDFSMGVDGPAVFPEYNIHLEPGEIVILYTTGVINQIDPSDKLYGENSLKEIVRTKSFLGAKEIAKAISDNLAQYSKNASSAEEDMTIIVLKAKEKESYA